MTDIFFCLLGQFYPSKTKVFMSALRVMKMSAQCKALAALLLCGHVFSLVFSVAEPGYQRGMCGKRLSFCFCASVTDWSQAD